MEVVVYTRFPVSGNFVLKNITSNVTDGRIISATNGGTLEAPLFTPGPNSANFEPKLVESIKTALGSVYLLLSVFGTCRDNRCRVNILFEKKREPCLIRVLMLMGDGQADSIVREIKPINWPLDIPEQRGKSRKKNSVNHS